MPVVFMRHGERLDYADKTWTQANQSARPWDPPLTATGVLQAQKAGGAIRTLLAEHDLPEVTRVFTSPLIRCVETAVEAATNAGFRGVLNVEPALTEHICDMWYYSWAVPGADAAWGGPPSCRVGTPVAEDKLNPHALRPGGHLYLTPDQLQGHFSAKLSAVQINPMYRAFTPASTLTQNWHRGETQEDCVARMKFAEYCNRVYPGETVLLVTHGGCAGATYGFLTNGPPMHNVGVTAIFIMVKEAEAWKPLVTKSVEHLKEGGLDKDLGYATAGLGPTPPPPPAAPSGPTPKKSSKFLTLASLAVLAGALAWRKVGGARL